MYQKDFILRMIEMLGDLVAGIFGLIKKGKFEQATKALENAYYDFLKQDAAFFRMIPKAKLTDELIGIHNYTNGHLQILSELFFTEAELSYSENKHSKSLEYYEKTLLLMEYISKESNTYSSESIAKIDLIKKRIEQFNDMKY